MSGEQELYLSAASSWEISIKWSLGKLPLPEPPARYVLKRLPQQNITSFSITHAHRLAVSNLLLYHNDPFDRLMIAQAHTEGMTILTADPVFRRHRVEVFWCGP